MADESYNSPIWHRVAEVKPRLRRHAKITRQMFRGQVWYVVEDPSSGRYHRISPSANLLVSLMDGIRNVQDIWDIACAELEDEIVSQEDVVRLLAQLHASDLLLGDNLPDMSELSQRGDKLRKRKLIMSSLNPLAVRIPILDPDRFLTATLPLVRPLFSWFGALIWHCHINSLLLKGIRGILLGCKPFPSSIIASRRSIFATPSGSTPASH